MIPTPEKNFRSSIQSILEQSEPESEFRLDRELVNVTCQLNLDDRVHVPDLLTRIRVLPTVSVVGQTEKVIRSSAAGGKASLDIYIKFLPAPGNTLKNLRAMARLVKSLPGVNIVKIIAVGGKRVMYQGKPLVI